MLTESVFIFNPASIGGGQYTVELFFNPSSKAKFLNLGDYIEDTSNNRYKVTSATLPFTDGGTITVDFVDNDVLPDEDTGYDSIAYTPGQLDLRPTMRTAGALGTFTIFNATNYEYQGLFSPVISSEANKAIVGDSIVDPNGKEFEITFIDGTNRFADPIRITEKERVGESPVSGNGALFRATTNFGFYQGTEVTDPARTNIFNRDKAILDNELNQSGSSFDVIDVELTVSALDVTNKETTLPATPLVPDEVFATIVGGTTLDYGVDYIVVGNKLNWNGLGLDGLISDGDVIRVRYHA